MAPGLPEISSHYSIPNSSLTALTLSIFLLAWAIGPLIFAPLSEIYGRKWILIFSNLFFLIFNIACIFAPTYESLIGFRFLAGLGAGTPISISGSVVGDLFIARERAGPAAASFLGVLLGPPTGPIMGGYIAQTVGFKYSFVVTSALAGVCFIMSVMFLQETYGPVEMARVARKRLASLEGEGAVGLSGEDAAELEYLQQKGDVSVWKILGSGFARPIQHLYGSWICLVFSLYAAMSVLSTRDLPDFMILIHSIL